jgi:hypothetical protein
VLRHLERRAAHRRRVIVGSRLAPQQHPPQIHRLATDAGAAAGGRDAAIATADALASGRHLCGVARGVQRAGPGDCGRVPEWRSAGDAGLRCSRGAVVWGNAFLNICFKNI